jgi:hypothetical protein
MVFGKKTKKAKRKATKSAASSMEIGLDEAQAIAEYIYLTGFNKTATRRLMRDDIKKMLLKEGFTINPRAEKRWFSPDIEKASWSQRFVGKGMSYLGTPVLADQINNFRKMQPLIIEMKSKNPTPAGARENKFVRDIKSGMTENIQLMAAGVTEFEDTPEMLKEPTDGDAVPTDSPATKVALTIPGSVPKLSHTRKLKKRTFPKSGSLPAGSGPIIVTMKPLGRAEADLLPAPFQVKTKWNQPVLTLIFEQGATIKYALSNTSDLYEVVMDGKPVIFEGGNVFLEKFAASPKTVTGFEAKLSQGSFNVRGDTGVTEFFNPDLIKKDGFPFSSGVVAPLIGFPIPDLTKTEVGGVDHTFNMTTYIDYPAERKNWFPPLGYKTLDSVTKGSKGTATNPDKWVAIYSEIESIQWSPDGLTAQGEYLQPLPFNAKKAKSLDLKNEYIHVGVQVVRATDIYTGYDWKTPTSTAGTLIFPGDERNLIPLLRTDPDAAGTELKIKGAGQGNAIKEILFHNGIAEIKVDGGSFRIPDDSGDGTFYALDNTSDKIDGKRQELKCRVTDVMIENYEAKATADTVWTNMRAARRYKNLDTQILPGPSDGAGATCPECQMENVVSPCQMEGCPMPLESEVGVGSLGYFTKEASGTYLILLVPNEADPDTTYEIRMTVKN